MKKLTTIINIMAIMVALVIVGFWTYHYVSNVLPYLDWTQISGVVSATVLVILTSILFYKSLK